MDPPRSARTLEVPTILVGLGRFGAAVCNRLRDERVSELRLAGADEGLGDDLSVVLASATTAGIDAEALAGRVLARVRATLDHTRMVRLRDQAGLEQQSRLNILVYAHLAEAAVRSSLRAVLEQIQRRMLGELGPIFESYRTGSRRGATVLPMLAMPHPAGHDHGEDVIRSVRELTRSLTETAPENRAVSKVYLIEDVAEFSVLSDDDMQQCMRNFGTLLLYAGIESDRADALFHGTQRSEPLGTFVCAVAELPRPRLAAYGANRVALEVLAAVQQAPRIDSTLSEADALEEIEATEYRPDDEAEADVRAVLERYAPSVDPDPHPAWHRRGSETAQRYGPDDGDPSLMKGHPAPDPPVGWALERMRDIEDSWRLLQRKRFDDVVARDRAHIEAWRDDLLDRINRRVDRELWEDPSPQSLRKAQEVIARFQRAFREQLDDAIRQRDAARPSPPPEFAEFRSAHGTALDAARRKPDPDRMLLWGLLGVLTVALLGPPVLRMFADALGMSPQRWWEPGFREYAWVTAPVVGLAAIGGLLGYRLMKAHMALTGALDGMWTALRNTITGRRDSVLDYFASRLRLSRSIARVESLLAVQAALDADAERLVLTDKAARRATSQLRDEQRELGVTFGPDGEDIGRMLGRGEGALVESFVAADAGDEITRALPIEGRENRVHSVLRALADHYGQDDRWREELPFASLTRLKDAARRHADPIANWDPFAGADRAQKTAGQLAAFVRRQVRSLGGALNFTGYEDRDASGFERPFRTGEAIVPRGAVDRVQAALADDAIRSGVRAGAEGDRAYYAMVVGGIDLAAVASLREASTDRAVPRVVRPPATSFDPPKGTGNGSSTPSGAAS